MTQEVEGHCHHNEEKFQDESSTLLQLQKLRVACMQRKGTCLEAACIWDPGSTLSFITFALARKLRLQGEPVELEICTVGGVETKINSQRYNLALFDRHGKEVLIEVLGIEQISTNVENVNLDGILKLFSKVGVSEVDRPSSGPVDLLIGYSYAGYHPVKIESNGHLLLMENRFGYIIAGSHQDIAENTRKLVQHAVVLHVDVAIEKFHSIESLGVACNPSCGGCRCGTCHAGGKNMTLEEEKEYLMIREGLSFDEDSGRWRASYPWVKDPSCLPQNRNFAYATLQSTEKRLGKNQLYANTYRRQMHDMLERKAARLVSEEELRKYSGTKFYIAHHDVLSPASSSTPMRVVFNSSARLKCSFSLNDCLAKGPCLLNHLLGILLRFRKEGFAFIGDIKKMFHSIDIPIQDQMTHLFLWRNLETAEQPKTYAMTVVNMGDRPASAIAQTALRMTAEEAEEEYPEASKLLMRNSYMDDIPGSVASAEIGMKLMQETETILEAKGFKLKNWTFSGQAPKKEMSVDQVAVQTLMQRDVENEMGKVLGMGWETESDSIRFLLKSLDSEMETTKRQCLSLICSIYDPIGLLAPVTVTAKIILRKIWASKPVIDWDDPLPDELQVEWIKFRESLSHVRNLEFYRSLKPDKAEAPVLVIFSDGSKDAYGTVAYVRWKTPGGFTTRLIAAKSRIAPLRIVNIVRLELCGAVLNARLFSFIRQELEELQFEKVFHIVDSEIAKAMIGKDSYGFSTFAANRIGEIHEKTEKENWYWIEGSLNVADITTRSLETEVTDLGMDGDWQNGPSFLALPEEQWPIISETNVPRLPEQRRKFVGNITKAASSSIASRMDADRFSNLSRLLYTTARIEKLFRRFKKGGDECDHRILPKDLTHAEETWVKYVQEDVSANLVKYKKLLPTLENGIVVVGGRAERWIYSTWNREKFILLPANHRFSRLVAEMGHIESGHLAVESTVARIRSKYWIMGVRKIVKSIIGRCRTCKLKFKMLAAQRMSPLPVERIKPSPPFQNVGLDYFGPFEVKGEVQKRVRGKCYGVLFTCDSSRAVHADIVQNYSTDAFLQALRRFASIRGWPQRIHSDNGTQLAGAATELKKMVADLGWEAVETYGHKFNTIWSFCPADAPWQNGSTEALIKTIKHALNVVLGNQVCSYAEFQTMVYEAAQLVNQRPIGRQPLTPDDGTYLCPNDLILGRSTNHVPQGPFLRKSNLTQRLNFIQEIVDHFWKRWSREVFPSLVIEPKWHVERRNLSAGDVVMIQDSNVVRGEWRIGIVVNILNSKDGRVRNVEVKYKSGTTEIKVKRAVQRLIVLVPAEGTTKEE